MTTEPGSRTEPTDDTPIQIVERANKLIDEIISDRTIVKVERLNEVKDMLVVLVGFVEDVASEIEKDPVTRAKQLMDLLGLEHG